MSEKTENIYVLSQDPLTDERIAEIVLRTVYEGDASIPYRDAWVAEFGIPFARAIEQEHGIRPNAAELDKQGMPAQAECCRQAARHMETREMELKHALAVTGETLDKEFDDGDALLRLLGLDPATYRTDGSRMNLLKIRAALGKRMTPNA